MVNEIYEKVGELLELETNPSNKVKFIEKNIDPNSICFTCPERTRKWYQGRGALCKHYSLQGMERADRLGCLWHNAGTQIGSAKVKRAGQGKTKSGGNM